ncbi:hypothetical protein JL722_4459 [Aureococcus anophagefferens]|nr:hypothetical protein JL722_4459 [Aureococcus anophagefferens]
MLRPAAGRRAPAAARPAACGGARGPPRGAAAAVALAARPKVAAAALYLVAEAHGPAVDDDARKTFLLPARGRCGAADGVASLVRAVRKAAIAPRSLDFDAAAAVAVPSASPSTSGRALDSEPAVVDWTPAPPELELEPPPLLAPSTMGGFKLYQVIGRKAPTPQEPEPSVYRMKLFAPNEVLARSRYWYYMHQYRKMKKTTGEILDVNEIREKNPRIVKNYYVMLRYNSRSNTHNMYREYRDLTLTGAIDQLYSEMAGRHRARPRSIQIIRTGIVDPKDLKRPATQQFAAKGLKFPLPHRIMRPSQKKFRATFVANRPCTHFQ